MLKEYRGDRGVLGTDCNLRNEMDKTRTLSASLQNMTRVLRAEDAGCLSDAELVQRFVACRDDAAFGAIVRRYGIIVLGVCRRVLRHEHDAEDAFQATFLILARKAATIQRTEEVGNWLYGVAYNVARKAKTYRHRREIKEREAAPQQPQSSDLAWHIELREFLDRELYALADKYRTPIVLCDLRGLTIEEAAVEAGCLPKTLGTRLSRGRAILAKRLTRRGVAVSVGTLGAVLASCEPSVGLVQLSPRLLTTTIRTAIEFSSDPAAAIPPMVAALTKGVSNVMVLKSLKYVALLSLFVLVSSGVVKHLSLHAATAPTEQQAANRNPTALLETSGKKPHARTSHLEMFEQHLAQLLSWFDDNDPKSSEPANIDDKSDKDKQAPTGVWIKKDGDLEFKLDFSEKGMLKIDLRHGDKGGVITCEYSPEKDGILKAKITKVEAIDHIKDNVPEGAEFKFKWTAKDNTATLEEMESKKAPIMKHLEGKFEQKK
jgi:RNA polymerase sigma factor (sigma-70 family)